MMSPDLFFKLFFFKDYGNILMLGVKYYLFHRTFGIIQFLLSQFSQFPAFQISGHNISRAKYTKKIKNRTVYDAGVTRWHQHPSKNQ